MIEKAEEWFSIGNKGDSYVIPFLGTFYGEGHTIRLNSSGAQNNYQGLFARIGDLSGQMTNCHDSFSDSELTLYLDGIDDDSYGIYREAVADPYLISTPGEWEQIEKQMMASGSDDVFSGIYFKQTADIAITQGICSTGEGNSKAFYGTYDGDGHRLNCTLTPPVSGSTEAVAPFHLVNGATIKNLCVEGTINDGDTHTYHVALCQALADMGFQFAIDANSTFDVTISGSVLDGADVRTLVSSSFDDGTLTLNFSETSLSAIEAGKPYIIKWEKAETNIESPKFCGVVIDDAYEDGPILIGEEDVDPVVFSGTYMQNVFIPEAKEYLNMGAENTLYYPSGTEPFVINAFHAIFVLQNGLVAGDPTTTDGQQAVNRFVLNFGDDVATGITTMDFTNHRNEVEGTTTTDFTDHTNETDAWYTLDGRRLSGKPTQKGIYIHNGKKIPRSGEFAARLCRLPEQEFP